MAKPLFRWNIYLVQSKGRWLGEIEAGTAEEAIKIASERARGEKVDCSEAGLGQSAGVPPATSPQIRLVRKFASLEQGATLVSGSGGKVRTRRKIYCVE